MAHNFNTFCELKANDPMENIFPKATSTEEGFKILRDYLLGDDWFVVMPMGPTQVNTEAIADIMLKIPSAKYRNYPWWKKLFINLKCLFTFTPKHHYY